MNRLKSIAIFLGIIVIGGAIIIVIFRQHLINKYPRLAFDVIPSQISTPHDMSNTAAEWKQFSHDGVVLKIPSAWPSMEIEDKPSKAFVIADDRNYILIIGPQDIKYSAFRSALYAKWHPIRLLKKALVIPRLDQDDPQMLEQQIGSWSAFVFPGSEHWWFFLFQENVCLSLVFQSKQGNLTLDESLMKDIASTAEIVEIAQSRN